MPCSCEDEPVAFDVPAALRECAPSDSGTAAICPRCLSVGAVDDAPAEEADGPDDPAISRVNEAFPGGDAGLALALALGLLESLALNRREIETALERCEHEGADPLLAIDRLLDDPSVEPAIDLERRRTQVESLLY